MDWDKLRAFNAAAQAGSFTNAGALLNLSQSAISRQITALEQDLKTCLFHRHARGLKLTEQGEFLHGTVREIIARISMAEARLGELRDQPRGLLRISADAAFGTFWLAPLLKDFHELYPEITPVLLLDGGGADLAMGEADVAIRMSPAQKSDLIQRRLLCWRSGAYAAPEYLRRHGIPCSPAELRQHRLVVLATGGKDSEAKGDWLLRLNADGVPPPPPIALLDNVCGLYRAVASGLGIGALPRFIAAEADGLIRVLPDLASPRIDGYFVYPAELRQSKRIAVFRDFLIRKIAGAGLSVERGTDADGPDLGNKRDAAPFMRRTAMTPSILLSGGHPRLAGSASPGFAESEGRP